MWTLTKMIFKKIVEANNQLGLQMVQELKTEDNENIFISPISQYMAFSMLYQGANGETKSELAKLLKVNKQTAEDINKANASLLKKLKSDDKGLQLHIANSLWVDNDYELKKDYQHTINDYYQGTIEPIDGSNKADTEKINKWVAEKTNHKN